MRATTLLLAVALAALAAGAGAWDVLIKGINPPLDGSVKATHLGASPLRVLLFSTNFGNVVGLTNGRLETEDRMDLDEVWMELRTTGGKGKLGVTVYVTDKPRASRLKKHHRAVKTFAAHGKGDGNEGETHRFSVSGVRGKYLGVILAGKNGVRHVRYQLRVQRGSPEAMAARVPLKPRKEAAAGLGPVCGFADLHAHLVGEVGFGGIHFKHGVEDGAKDPGYLLKLSHTGKQPQQMSIPALRRAHREGLQILVSPAINNEFLCVPKKFSCNDMSSALRQTRYALDLVQRHSDFMRVVRDPYEARRAVHDGKLAVVLAVEVSNLMPEIRGYWRDQLHELYDLGVRSVVLAHEFNSVFAGAAPHAAILEIAQALQSGITATGGFERDSRGYNKMGLTAEGRKLVREMVRLGMVLDAAHLGVNSARDFVDELNAIQREESRAVPVPFMNSHERFAGAMPAHEVDHLGEFTVMEAQVAALKAHRGMVGVRNGPEHVETVVEPNNCDGSTTGTLGLVAWGLKHGVQVALGSDLNGHAAQTGPRRGENACPNPPKLKNKRRTMWYRNKQREAQVKLNRWVNSEYDTVGMAHVGLEGDLVRDMYLLSGNGDRSAADAMARSAENFLRLWERMHGDDSRGTAPHYVAPDSAKDSKMVCVDLTKPHAGESPAGKRVDKKRLGDNFDQPKGAFE